MRDMPQFDLADWLGGLTLYYKPDSREGFETVAFEMDDCDFFTRKEATAHWVKYSLDMHKQAMARKYPLSPEI